MPLWTAIGSALGLVFLLISIILLAMIVIVLAVLCKRRRSRHFGRLTYTQIVEIVEIACRNVIACIYTARRQYQFMDIDYILTL